MSSAQAATWEAAEGWRRDAIHYPARPLHHLDISYLVDTIGPGSQPGFDEWSLPIARSGAMAVNNWVYNRIEPFGDPPKALLKFEFLAHLWRIVPPLRKRILGFDRFLAAGGFEDQISTWERIWRPEAERRLAELRDTDISGVNRDQMAAHLEAWHEYMTWQWSAHIRCHMVCFYVRGKFADVCRRLFGMDDLDAYDLIKGSDPVLFEAPRKLATMARRAAADPVVREALNDDAARALEALRGTWFDDELAAFLDAHGDVPVDGFELALPTWRELPHRVVGLVQQLVAANHDPVADEESFQAQRAARVAELRATLSGGDLVQFDRWLALGERAYPLNDNHNHLLLEWPAGLIRYAARRAGELLARDGVIDGPGEVFFLYKDELTSLLRESRDVRPLIASRRAGLAQARELDPPDVVGDPPPIPPTHVFPPRVGEALRILLEQAEKMYGTESGAAHTETTLTGTPGSPGMAEGRACVVSDLNELDKVRAGDVLVCPITGPAWTVVFPLVAGLVTESGGPLSHPAIVAREYGIPSVVGTRNATRVLRDGQRVRVDGTNAVVTVLDSLG